MVAKTALQSRVCQQIEFVVLPVAALHRFVAGCKNDVGGRGYDKVVYTRKPPISRWQLFIISVWDSLVFSV